MIEFISVLLILTGLHILFPAHTTLISVGAIVLGVVLITIGGIIESRRNG